MAKKGGNPQNLNPGGTPGNAGGGVTKEVRRTKAALLEAILNAKDPKSGRPVQEVVDEALIADILSPKGAVSRMWFVNQQVGMPNAKVEHLVNENLGVALLQAIKQLTVPLSEEQAKELISALEDNLTAMG